MPPSYSRQVAPSHVSSHDLSLDAGLREQNLRFILGLKLHNLRQERRLSLVQLSQACGLSVSYLNEIEKGKKYPKTDKLLALARALGVSYNDLVSAEPGGKLRSISGILTTRMVDDLPLAFYGISASVLMEMMAADTTRVGALLQLLKELSQRFDIGTTDFCHSAIRSHLEAQTYYFEDLEREAAKFADSCGWSTDAGPSLDQLRACLVNRLGWELDEQLLGIHGDLDDVGAVPYAKGKRRCLLLHPSLPEGRRAFFIAREIAAHVLQLTSTRTSSSKQPIGEFQLLLDDARASYLAGAMLMPEASFVGDVRTFALGTRWDPDAFLALIAKHGNDTETFFHRLAQLLPRHLGLGNLVLARTEIGSTQGSPRVNREIRLGETRDVSGSETGEHRCRRMMNFRLLSQAPVPNTPARAAIQRERFHASNEAYLTLGTVFKRPLHQDLQTCMTLAIGIDAKTRNAIGFVDDPAIDEYQVGETCERCTLSPCEERVAPPVVAQTSERGAARRAALASLFQSLDR